MAAYIRSVTNNTVSKGKFRQLRYDSLRFENYIATAFDILLFITDLIYAATPPLY